MRAFTQGTGKAVENLGDGEIPANQLRSRPVDPYPVALIAEFGQRSASPRLQGEGDGAQAAAPDLNRSLSSSLRGPIREGSLSAGGLRRGASLIVPHTPDDPVTCYLPEERCRLAGTLTHARDASSTEIDLG